MKVSDEFLSAHNVIKNANLLTTDFSRIAKGLASKKNLKHGELS
jgi:hypothetical protein